MRTSTILLLSAFILAIVLLVTCRIYMPFLIFNGTFENKYTREEVIKNYFDHEAAIQKLTTYFISKYPEDRDLTFGPGEHSHSYAIGVTLPDGSVDPKRPPLGGPNLTVNSSEMDTVLSYLHWTPKTLDTLSELLEASNCHNIMSRDPIRLQFSYSGFGLFEYYIFDQPLPDSVVRRYEDKFGDTVLRPNVVQIYRSSL